MPTHSTYVQFLIANGVPEAQAATIAENFTGKTARRERLTEPEAMLTAMYLGRSGANPSAEQYLAHSVTGWAGAQSSATGRNATSGLATGKRQHKPFSSTAGQQGGHMTVLVDGMEINDSSAQYRTVITKLATAAEKNQALKEDITLNPARLPIVYKPLPAEN